MQVMVGRKFSNNLVVKEPFTAVLRKNPPLMLIYTLKNTTEQ